MLPLPDHTCLGFFFRYFRADSRGRPREVDSDDHFAAAEDAFLNRMREVLQGRPDVLHAAGCMEEPLEVRLHGGDGFWDWDEQLHFYGRVHDDGAGLVLELATEQILDGCGGDHTALDVVVHELIHVLDHMGERDDGLLVGWEPHEIEAFVAAREAAVERLRAGDSPLDPYALTSNGEFLAVVGETFFARPHDLRRAEPELYELFAQWFAQDPAASTA